MLFQSDREQAKQIYPIRLKENLQLNTYSISKSFKLNANEYVLIGKSNSENDENLGYRMLYIAMDSSAERFQKKYISKPKEEAYVYNPYFFEFLDGEKFIIVEEGYEYMAGIDIYRLRNSKIDFLGNISISGPNRDSVIGHIKIEKLNDEYKILFSGQVEYRVSSDNIINGSTLLVSIIEDELKIDLK